MLLLRVNRQTVFCPIGAEPQKFSDCTLDEELSRVQTLNSREVCRHIFKPFCYCKRRGMRAAGPALHPLLQENGARPPLKFLLHNLSPYPHYPKVILSYAFSHGFFVP